ncbi:MAG: alpha/beta hydrolase fold domain-containing protein [Flavobacteriales bacterium]
MCFTYFKFLFFIFFQLFFYSCSKPEIIKNDSIKINTFIDNIKIENLKNNHSVFLENIHYGQGSQQICDIYLPENRSVEFTKIIILIHGGSWISGDKTDMNEFLNMINCINENYAVVNMNYTLANNSIPAFPNQFIEIETLLNSLTENSNELQILPEFALVGQSAGGHLALMYDYIYDLENRVKAVCTLGAPTDFTNEDFQDRPNFYTHLMSLIDESAYPENSDFISLLSPALQVNSYSSPTLIFQGNLDNIVPVDNAWVLNDNLQVFEIEKKLVLFNTGHSNWNSVIMQSVKNKLKNYLNLIFPI